MKIIPHINPSARQCQIKAIALLLKSNIVESGGKLMLYGNKGDKAIPCWRKLREVAPECFTHGYKPTGSIEDILMQTGILISGGTSHNGKLIATLVSNQSEDPV